MQSFYDVYINEDKKSERRFMKRKFKMLVLLCGILSCCGFIAIKANSYNFVQEQMASIDMLGKYVLTYATSTNTSGCQDNIHGYQPVGTPMRLYGDGGGRITRIDPKGKYYGESGNSSSSTLSKPTANAKIEKAYLLQESHYYDSNEARVLVDYPMTLVAPSGNRIKANTNTVFGSANGVGVTITDVTDFVKAEGFGAYQGWDIPYYNRKIPEADQVASWKLVVVCEDDSLPFRMLRMKMGSMSSSGTTINVAIDGAGIKTKANGNVTGQIIIGGTGGDPDWHGSYFDLSPSPTTPSIRLNTGTNGQLNHSNNFFEGIVVQNGQQRRDTSVTGYRNSDNLPVNNTDMILLDTNSTQSNAQNGHNAYFVNNSNRMSLSAITEVTNGNLNLFGMLVDIDTATYASSITHPSGNIVANKEVMLSATASNNTVTSKNNLGVTGGLATLTLDNDLQINPNKISAVFTRAGGGDVAIPPSAIYVNGNTVKVRYGIDGQAKSQVGDKIKINVPVTPRREKNNYKNTILVSGTGLVDETGANHDMGMTMKLATASDTFNVINPPVITASNKTFYDQQYTSDYWLNTLRSKDVSAQDNEDGNLTSSLQVIYDNVNVNVPGTYKVTYSSTDSNRTTTTKDIQVTGLYNNPPVLNVVNRRFYEGEFTSEYWNTTLLRKDITSTDIEDGTLTSKIKVVKDTVDVSRPGKYEVIYKITDKYNKTTTKTSTVEVLFNNPPVLTAPSYSFYEDEITKKEWKNDYLMKDVSAIDVEDGDITDLINVDFNNVDPTIPGNYQVVYSVEDQYGKITKKTTDVEIKYNTPPKIHAENKRFMENEYTQKEWKTKLIKDKITAQDTEDGDISKDITIEKDTVNMSIPGFYRVEYAVMDAYGKKDKKTIEVEIVYNSLAIITANNKSFFEGELTHQEWLEEVLKDVTAVDSEDGVITDHIQVIEDNVDVATPGSYEVTYKVIDSGGKEVRKAIDVTIKANQTPTLTIFAENKRFIEGQYTLEEWIKKQRMENVSAMDVEDNVLTDKIVILHDNVKPDKAGTYEVTYEVTDKYGKSVEQTIKVTVEPNLPPVIHASERWFKISDVIDEKELLKKAIAYDDVDGDITNTLKIIENTVEQGIVGDYTVSYKAIDSLGKETVVQVVIHVIDQGGSPMPPVDPPVPPSDNNAVIFANGRNYGTIHLKKMLENSTIVDESAYESVVFGIYARDDIVWQGHVVLEKDSLVGIIHLNDNKEGEGKVYHAGQYYCKEIAVDEQYVLSDKEFDFKFVYE